MLLNAKQWVAVLEELGYYQDPADENVFVSSGLYLPKAIIMPGWDEGFARVDIIAPHLESCGLPTEAISDAIEKVMGSQPK